jgi:hypothetical protein
MRCRRRIVRTDVAETVTPSLRHARRLGTDRTAAETAAPGHRTAHPVHQTCPGSSDLPGSSTSGPPSRWPGTHRRLGRDHGAEELHSLLVAAADQLEAAFSDETGSRAPPGREVATLMAKLSALLTTTLPGPLASPLTY